MTTGDPVVARVAMKPLPTLTKPLRSVDIETKQPAEALRERTDSCTVPAAGVVGEAMVALELARACREKFGGDAMRRRARGGRRLPGAHRMAEVGERRSPRTRAAGGREAGDGRLHGRRQVDAAAGAPRSGSAGRWRMRTRLLEERLGEPIAAFFDREGEAASASASRTLVLELLGAAGRGGRRRSAAAPSRADAVRDALAGHVVRARGGRRRDAPGSARRRLGPAAGARPRALRRAARARAGRCTSRWPRVVAGRRRREDARRS